MPDGTFKFTDVELGSYALRARGGRDDSESPPEPGEYGTIPITVTGADIEEAVIALQPSAVISGRVIFEPATPAKLPANLRVGAVAPGPSPTRAALVGTDLSFTLRGLDGPRVIRLEAPGYNVKAVMLGETALEDHDVHRVSDGESSTEAETQA